MSVIKNLPLVLVKVQMKYSLKKVYLSSEIRGHVPDKVDFSHLPNINIKL